MFSILEALFPLFTLILMGYCFKHWNFPGTAFWPLAEKFTNYALLPALLFTKLATVDLQTINPLPMMGAIISVALLIALILLLLKPKLPVSGPAFTSIFQGSIRPNTYVGLAAAAALYQDQGLALTAVAILALIPLVNFLSVIVLMHFGTNRTTTPFKKAWAVLKNPLIVACLFGLIFNYLGFGLPYGSQTILDLFGRAALLMGLLSVGVSFNFTELKTSLFPLILASGIKLIGLAILTTAACWVAQVNPMGTVVAVMYISTPTGPSGYIQSKEYGGDPQLMATLVTCQTLFAVISMPAVIFFLTRVL